MLCAHRNTSIPFREQRPNPKAGQPISRINPETGVEEYLWEDGMIQLQPEVLDFHYIRCLDCGKQADYDMDEMQRVGSWVKEQYVHMPVRPGGMSPSISEYAEVISCG